MVKRKKTLEQKKLADMRRYTYSLDNRSSIVSIKNRAVEIEKAASLPTSYLGHSIVKTAILTAVILFSQILLSILLKNRIVQVPFVSY